LILSPCPCPPVHVKAFRLRNTGSRRGDETPQAYLSEPAIRPEGVAFPVRKLVAFDHVSLRAGQSRTDRLRAPPRQLQYWSVARHEWVAATGRRRVYVGSSSRDFQLERETESD
jgi:beta-glucosidase